MGEFKFNIEVTVLGFYVNYNSGFLILQQNAETIEASTLQTPNKSSEKEEMVTAGQSSAPTTPDSANVSLNTSMGESPASTPSGSGKGKTRRGKRKREPSVEDIYQNKLWRTQMPKEKNWETIFEEPKSKKGQKEYQSNKRFKRFCNFDEFYNQNRLKRRRQKALKRGWKPLTKKKEEKVGKLVEEKLLALDQELIEEEMPDTSISETLALLGEPSVSLPPEQHETNVSASPTKSVMSCCVGESTSSKDTNDNQETGKPQISVVVEEVDMDTGRTESTKSSQSDVVEYFTPNATLTKTGACGKGNEKETLSAIGEDEDEMFFTPAAKAIPDTVRRNSPPADLESTSKDHSSKSPDSSDKSSDSLSLTKTPGRPEEVADLSGVYSLSP